MDDSYWAFVCNLPRVHGLLNKLEDRLIVALNVFFPFFSALTTFFVYCGYFIFSHSFQILSLSAQATSIHEWR